MIDDQYSKRLTQAEATEVFMQYFGYVRATAFEYAPVASLIDDIVHDTYVCFVEKAERWDYDDTKIMPLLKSLVRAMAGRQWQSYQRNLPAKLREVGELLRSHHTEQANVSGSYSELDSKLSALRCCLEKLSPENRKLIEIYYFGNASYSEIAEQLGRSPTAIYKAFARIRAALHDCVTQIIRMEVDRERL